MNELGCRLCTVEIDGKGNAVHEVGCVWAENARLQERVECEREHRLQHVELQLKAERERDEARALVERRKEALADCLQEFERICSYAAKLHVQAEEAGAGGLGVHDAWFASHAEQGKLKACAAIEEEA